MALITISCSYESFKLDISNKSHAQRAKEFRESGDHKSAIEHYEKHITARLQDKSRPLEENPYFYYILIGDTYLEHREFENAKASYIKAKDNQVEAEIIAFRIRKLALWLHENQRSQSAIELLTEYRELDDLSLDYEIDRIHREMVKREQSGTVEAQ